MCASQFLFPAIHLSKEKKKKKTAERISGLFSGSRTRIRTQTNRVRVCRATITQSGYQAPLSQAAYFIINALVQKVKPFLKIFLRLSFLRIVVSKHAVHKLYQFQNAADRRDRTVIHPLNVALRAGILSEQNTQTEARNRLVCVYALVRSRHSMRCSSLKTAHAGRKRRK